MSETTPLISVVISDDRAKYPVATLARCIRSLVLQNSADFEVIIFHNGNKDKGYKGELNRADHRRLDLAMFTGQQLADNGSALRNKGLQKATGDYVIFLDAADWLYNQAIATLARLIKSAAKAPDCIVVPVIKHGVTGAWDEATKQWQITADDSAGAAAVLAGFPPSLGNESTTLPMQLVMRREHWLASNGWPDDRAAAEVIGEHLQKHSLVLAPSVLGESH